jgi:hypothetical protein
MKTLRITAFALLAAFIGTCGYLAYQSDQDKVQQEIDKSPENARFYRLRLPCPPACEEDAKTQEYIAKLNSEWPIKKVGQISDLQLARLDRTDEEWRTIDARTQSHAQMRKLYNIHE